MSRIVIGLILWGLHGFALGAPQCASGLQPYANRCVQQRTADYISCVEATGGNRQGINQEFERLSDRQVDGGAKAGAAVKGKLGSASAAFNLSKKDEAQLIERIELRWFPGATSMCLRMINSTSSIAPTKTRAAYSRAELARIIADRKAESLRSFDRLIAELPPGLDREEAIRFQALYIAQTDAGLEALRQGDFIRYHELFRSLRSKVDEFNRRVEAPDARQEERRLAEEARRAEEARQAAASNAAGSASTPARRERRHVIVPGF